MSERLPIERVIELVTSHIRGISDMQGRRRRVHADATSSTYDRQAADECQVTRMHDFGWQWRNVQRILEEKLNVKFE